MPISKKVPIQCTTKNGKVKIKHVREHAVSVTTSISLQSVNKTDPMAIFKLKPGDYVSVESMPDNFVLTAIDRASGVLTLISTHASTELQSYSVNLDLSKDVLLDTLFLARTYSESQSEILY